MLDVQGEPSVDLRTGGSVPGHAKLLAGGVGRNIAASIALIGAGMAPPPLLVSVVGSDAAAAFILSDCARLGLPIEGIFQIQSARTPCVTTIFDRAGEVAASVADVHLLEQQLLPPLLQGVDQRVADAAFVVLDGNLDPQAIQHVCRVAAAGSVPTLFEPVSVAKAVRCVGTLQHLHYVSPNAAELVAMSDALQASRALPALHAPSHSCTATGGTAESPEAGGTSAELQLRRLQAHLHVVLSTGVRHVILTLGHLGSAAVWLLPGGDMRALLLPALPVHVKNLSGAGDCLVGALVAGLVRGRPLKHALALGTAMAALAIQSPLNVPEAVDASMLERSAASVAALAHEVTLPPPSKL